MFRVLVVLALGAIAIMAQPAPTQANHNGNGNGNENDGVECLSLESDGLLGFSFAVSKDGSWFIASPGFIYFSEDVDTLWIDDDPLEIKDRKNIFLAENGDTDKLGQKARFNAKVSLDGDFFRVEFKDPYNNREFDFRSSNDNFICDTI